MRKFTQEQINQANQTNLVGLAKQLGYKVEEGHKNNYHIKDHGGLYISETKNSFYCWAAESGGGPVQFMMLTEKMSWVDAVKYLVGDGEIQQQSTAMKWKKPSEQQRPEFKLPAKSDTYKRMFAYLIKTRHLDKDIVSELVSKKKIYESAPHHNVVFLGYDENGQPKQAFQRGTVTGISFKGEVAGGDKNYCFAMEGTGDSLRVFESAIDAISDATLYKIQNIDYKPDHRIALGGLSDRPLVKYLEQHPEIKKIAFCFDNDYDAKYSDGRPAPNWGKQAAEKLSKEYAEKGYYTVCDTAIAKDVNEDLITLSKAWENSKNNNIAANSNDSGAGQEI